MLCFQPKSSQWAFLRDEGQYHLAVIADKGELRCFFCVSIPFIQRIPNVTREDRYQLTLNDAHDI